MVLDLKEILKTDGETFKFAKSVPMQPVSFMNVEYSFAAPVDFIGYAKNISGTFEIYASVKGTLIIPCARCMRDTAYNFDLPYSDSFEISQNIARLTIELEDVINEAVICDIPMRVLCRDDCKGICPGCGVNLNEDSCKCTDEKSNEIWEKLKNLNLKDEV